MPQVTVHYIIYLTSGHHRQPRNTSSQLEPNAPTLADISDGGSIQPIYIPQLAYTQNGTPELAQMMFWSVTDGINGQVFPAGTLPTQWVGVNPLTITAWYYPTGGGGNGGTAIIDDAFSALLGTFIDDTFVTVTSDPSLTNEANVVGIVPTTDAEILLAAPSVPSTTEPFSKWLSFDAGTPSGDTINVPAGADGIAIAVYQRTSVSLGPSSGRYGIYGTLIGGVAVDGGGSIVINGVPHPVDPWGLMVVSLVQISLVTAGSGALGSELGAHARRIAAAGALRLIREALPNIEKEAQGGE